MIRAAVGMIGCSVMGLALATADGGAMPAPLASWVQYTADGVEVRSVARSGCPTLTVDGKSVNMAVRASPTTKHPNRVCTARIGNGTTSIKVADRALPVPQESPKTILIIGDTGCRLSSGHGLYQACNNSSEWPFRRLAESAASHEPDLIIYTGDYIYRESPCPEGNNGCKGSPYGDTQATWEADWLGPARSLHAVAPMILTRGNHETCERAGAGWFRYLDAHPYRAECKRNNLPWLADLGSHQVAVMDTANLNDEQGHPLTKRFEKELNALEAQLDKDAWIATHRPFWGYGADDDTGELTVQTSILQEVVRNRGLPAQTQLLIGAHIHLAQILGFGGSGRPPQLIIGNGGTQLVPGVPAIHEIDGEAIQTQWVLNQFGYALMSKPGGREWQISFFDQDGYELEVSRLRSKGLSCERSR